MQQSWFEIDLYFSNQNPPFNLEALQLKNALVFSRSKTYETHEYKISWLKTIFCQKARES